MDIKIGDKEVGFVYQGEELIYPNYVKDGLVLHYDFSGMGNNDVTRGVARDLSGNGNDGVLENFAFDEGSGYADNGLEFDGVDDEIIKEAAPDGFDFEDITVTSVFRSNSDTQKHVASLVSKGSWNQLNNLALGFSAGGNISFSYGVHNSDLVYSYSEIYLQDINIFTGVARGNTLELYINGVIVKSVAVERVPVINTYNLTIGAASYTSVYVDGNIYSTRIYNHALSPEEIAHNYKIDKHRFNIQD